jgi:hypothetical protein
MLNVRTNPLVKRYNTVVADGRESMTHSLDLLTAAAGEMSEFKPFDAGNEFNFSPLMEATFAFHTMLHDWAATGIRMNEIAGDSRAAAAYRLIADKISDPSALAEMFTATQASYQQGLTPKPIQAPQSPTRDLDVNRDKGSASLPPAVAAAARNLDSEMEQALEDGLKPPYREPPRARPESFSAIRPATLA